MILDLLSPQSDNAKIMLTWPDRSRLDPKKTHRVADTSQRHAVWVKDLQASGWRSRASVDEWLRQLVDEASVTSTVLVLPSRV